MEQEWQIQLTEGPKVVDAHDGLVVLEWQLNQGPKREGNFGSSTSSAALVTSPAPWTFFREHLK